ncbi:hypothetical protein INT43_004945 [Umbelopsis isabellina]|uniref:Uncharacterized protein n=1 Tax=Mortierella isabellina TaxID=91625 RepID=A0A8H7UA42_MORIS|nr:hypothetical protein INT43_004945 [Umbelopsis isabellina]
MSEKSILFVSLGSLGDVLPLLSLAVTVGHTLLPLRISFATHPNLIDQLGNFDLPIKVHFISIGPALLGPIVQKQEKIAQRKAELKDLSKSALQLSPDMIIFSTFCTEAWHLGETLSIPSIAVTLFPLDTGKDTATDVEQSTNSLKSELQRHVPELLEELEKELSSKVSWTDVDIWMSRLFSEEHGVFRDQLNLPPLVFLDDEEKVCLPSKTPVLLAYDTELVSKIQPNVIEDETYIFCGVWPCIFADYAATMHIANIILHIKPETSAGNIPSEDTLFDLLVSIDVAKNNGKNLVYIGFGSMDYVDHRLSEPKFIERLISSLNEALAQTNSFGVWLVSKENKAIYSTYTKLALHETPLHIYMYVGSIPHDFLIFTMQYGSECIVECIEQPSFEECLKQQSLITVLKNFGLDENHTSFRSVIAINHGGAGTVARFLRLATAQVVVPFLFDQFTWAQSLHVSDLAPEPLPAQILENHIICRYPISITAALWRLRIIRALSHTQSSHYCSVAQEISVRGMTGLHKAAKFVSNAIMSSTNVK